MKIEEIQELINYLGGMAIIKGCKYPQEEIRKAIATLERLKPATITADPETWPEDSSRPVAAIDVHGFPALRPARVLREYAEKHNWYGITWQYLPEWEE
jgi:hypothetical protein